MLQEIQEIIRKVTGKTGVTVDTDFIKDLKLNSFDIVNIVSAFEERFKVRVPTRDLRKLQTVRDVLEYMAAERIVK